MAALPVTETVDDDEKSPKRDPYPDEIESKEEANHPLKKYKDIAQKLDEIRKLQLDGILFEAYDKCEELKKYIQETYDSESEQLLNEFASHPRRKQIESQLSETNKMLDFMTADLNWKLYKDDGVWKTEMMHSDESIYASFRITGIGDVPLYNISAVIYEMDLIKTWMPLCKESIECGQMSLYCKCGLIRVGLFWPIQDRECVLFGYGVDDLKNGKLLIYFDSREDHNDHIKIPKCPKGRCRVDVFLGGFYFERLTENTTKITVVWNCDPKMVVPTQLINWFAGNFCSTLVAQIVKAAKFDETSEYFKRIQQNKEFYGLMRKRLNESKTMSDLKVADEEYKDNDDNDNNNNNDQDDNDDNKENDKQ